MKLFGVLHYVQDDGNYNNNSNYKCNGNDNDNYKCNGNDNDNDNDNDNSRSLRDDKQREQAAAKAAGAVTFG